MASTCCSSCQVYLIFQVLNTKNYFAPLFLLLSISFLPRALFLTFIFLRPIRSTGHITTKTIHFEHDRPYQPYPILVIINSLLSIANERYNIFVDERIKFETNIEADKTKDTKKIYCQTENNINKTKCYSYHPTTFTKEMI